MRIGCDISYNKLFGFLFIGVCGMYVFGCDGVVDVKFCKL